MEEIWKDIEGYEGLYQVSNMGRVKSLERTRNMNLPGHKKPAPVFERILKFGQSQGYQAVTLAKDGVNKKTGCTNLLLWHLSKIQMESQQ